ncbi:MAG: nucleotide exchange factor GrpE [Oligoflexales bacterium]|nr:nucleotide exchange factor GrpE [Oligoflexales bacterium]
MGMGFEDQTQQNTGDERNEADLNSSNEEARDHASSDIEDESEISSLKLELEEYKDKYLRAVAEFENIRRRAERERSELLKYGAEKLLKDIVPALDSFEKALSEIQAEAKGNSSHESLNEGIALVYKQVIEILRMNGLEAIQAIGSRFDPNLHQAIQKIEEEGVEHETVKEQYATGYTLHGRLLRPSMVSVIVPK